MPGGHGGRGRLRWRWRRNERGRPQIRWPGTGWGRAGSLPVHPAPARPAAEGEPDEQERRGPEDAAIQPVVEPAADRETDQRGQDDLPAEHADLAEIAGDGRKPLRKPPPFRAGPEDRKSTRLNSSHYCASRMR